jgi:uncharacterized protein (TIGR00725 family)
LGRLEKEIFMPQRCLVVGAIGGDRQKDLGLKFGAEVAKRGWIVLSGGEVKDSDEIKNATMLGADGAAKRDGTVARLVGILPSTSVRWRRPSPRHLFLETGLPHNVRNLIDGVTPDVVVVFGGSRGTLAEAAFAMAAGRRLIFCNALERLKQNFEKYFGADTNEIDSRTYFDEPVYMYPNAFATAQTSASLLALLRHTLVNASDVAPSQLIDAVADCDCVIGQTTGFPGLPNTSGSCERFEAIISEISS